MVVLAGLLVVPSFVYLYWLQQHGRLEESGPSANLVRAAAAQNDGAAPAPADVRPHRFLTLVLITPAVTDLIRDRRTKKRAARGDDGN